VSFELYEVWAEDAAGHQELIDTTKSHSHAMKLAQQTLTEGEWVATSVYKETEDGDSELIKEFENG
jgi:hypothetical protein